MLKDNLKFKSGIGLLDVDATGRLSSGVVLVDTVAAVLLLFIVSLGRYSLTVGGHVSELATGTFSWTDIQDGHIRDRP